MQLLKALYGLKQGAKNWYDALYRALLELGFTRCETDHRVFYKDVGKDIIIFLVHVDDGMVTGSNVKLIKKFKEDMHAKYRLTNLGAINWLLRIKITRDLINKTISLSQHAYIDAIITRFKFDDLKPSSIPIGPSAPLSKSQSPSKIERHYQNEECALSRSCRIADVCHNGNKTRYSFHNINSGWIHRSHFPGFYQYPVTFPSVSPSFYDLPYVLPPTIYRLPSVPSGL